jgi:hypothetical protein
VPELGNAQCIPIAGIQARGRIIRREEHKGVQKLNQDGLILVIEAVTSHDFVNLCGNPDIPMRICMPLVPFC